MNTAIRPQPLKVAPYGSLVSISARTVLLSTSWTHTSLDRLAREFVGREIEVHTTGAWGVEAVRLDAVSGNEDDGVYFWVMQYGYSGGFHLRCIRKS